MNIIENVINIIVIIKRFVKNFNDINLINEDIIIKKIAKNFRNNNILTTITRFTIFDNVKNILITLKTFNRR